MRFAKKHLLTVILISVFAVIVTGMDPMPLFAGTQKTGGAYVMSTDGISASSVVEAAGGIYSLSGVFGQPAGYTDMLGGNYALEGGILSGIETAVQLEKTITAVETPPGYGGSPTDHVPGSRLTFNLELVNLGDAAQDVVVRDVIPANMSYSTSSILLVLDGTASPKTDADTSDDECFATAADIQCEIPNIAAGATAAVVFKAVIN